ncbi:MAG TPA: hypothetical protein VGB96_08165, partial [Archangium sp.]
MQRRSVTTTSGRYLWQWWNPDSSWALDLHFVDGGPRGVVLDSYWAPGGVRDAGLQTATTFGYDAHGRVASVTSPQVAVTEDGVGTDVQMRPVTQSRSLQMAVLAAPGTGTLAIPAARVVPEAVRVEMTDARGALTRMAVDPMGLPRRIEGPLGLTTVHTRDRHGRVMASVDPSGHRTLSEYIAMNLVRSVDETLGRTVSFTYTADHQMLASTGAPRDVVNTYERGATDPGGSGGRLVMTESGGQVNSFEYLDARPLTTYGPGAATYYVYDHSAGSLNNLRRTTTSVTGLVSTWYAYDQYGRKTTSTTVVDPGYRDSTMYTYDLLNRPATVTDVAGKVTTYSYTPLTTTVTDARQQSYLTTRDALGRVVSRQDPRGGVERYRYDRNGNLTRYTNRRGQTVAYGYDVLNRMRWRDADGQRTTFDMDSLGRTSRSANAESIDNSDLGTQQGWQSGLYATKTMQRAGSTFSLASVKDAAGNLSSLFSTSVGTSYAANYFTD